MHATNGILFNHESPIRGETFVTRKITMAAARIQQGVQDCLYLGNLDAKRDWGFAGDYVDAMWRIVQHDDPQDFVVATGKMCAVREFCRMAFSRLGIELEFQGEGESETAVDVGTGKTVVAVDPRYFRPTEVDKLCGDPTKAERTLGWKARVAVDELVAMMADADRDALSAGRPFAMENSLDALSIVGV